MADLMRQVLDFFCRRPRVTRVEGGSAGMLPWLLLRRVRRGTASHRGRSAVQGGMSDGLGRCSLHGALLDVDGSDCTGSTDLTSAPTRDIHHTAFLECCHTREVRESRKRNVEVRGHVSSDHVPQGKVLITCREAKFASREETKIAKLR